MLSQQDENYNSIKVERLFLEASFQFSNSRLNRAEEMIDGNAQR